MVFAACCSSSPQNKDEKKPSSIKIDESQEGLSKMKINGGNNGHKKVDLSLPGKKGICYMLNGDAGANLDRVSKLNPHWNYSWNAQRIDDQPSDLEFVPMVWGGAKTPADMQKRIKQHILPQIEAGTCKRLLCFNEPDKPNQSNMTPAECIEFWPQFEKLGVPLCSPSCANPLACHEVKECCQGVSGSWMKDFMTQIDKRGYRCDYLGVHWYGGPSAKAFKENMRDIYEAYGAKRPLMITEFAVADWKAMNKCPEDNKYTEQQVLKFMKDVLPWLERQDWIAGYAWFPFDPVKAPQGTSSALFRADDPNKLTACGFYYRSVTKENPDGNQSIKVE